MPLRLYTLGYANWTIEEVHRQIDRLDGCLLDIRHVPHTSKPGFSKPELASRLGSRYQHVAGFGNVNYDGGDIQLAAPDEGRTVVAELERTPILMCGCGSPEQCHRTTVAQLLTEHFGGTATPLRPPSERSQPDLFSDT